MSAKKTSGVFFVEKDTRRLFLAAERYSPPGRAGRRIGDDDVAAGLEEGGANAGRPQDVARLLQDVPLGDAAEVQAHARCRQSDRLTGRVE
jgi:hypothetical protein